jgi:hypothetical protein
MKSSVFFSFRGRLSAADVATLQAKAEATVQSFGLSNETGVQARLERDGRGVIEVTNVPDEQQEPVRKAISDLLIAEHEAVITEE